MIFPIKNKKDHSGNAITLQYKARPHWGQALLTNC